MYENLEKKYQFFIPSLIPSNSLVAPNFAKGAQMA
jgi:hypothetical protein